MLDEVPFLPAAQWDRSGRMIAYQTADEEWEAHLRVVSVEDGTSYPIDGLEDLDEWLLLDWSPDGAWLAIRETVGRWEFWVNRDLLGQGGQSGATR